MTNLERIEKQHNETMEMFRKDQQSYSIAHHEASRRYADHASDEFHGFMKGYFECLIQQRKAMEG